MTSPVRAVDLDVVPAAPVPVVLALGSNLGDREAMLVAAVRDLAVAGLEVHVVSPVVETDPVGGPAQDTYLNAVVLVTTTLSPHALLAVVQQVEVAHGRERTARWGPRTLDVDVVTYGGLVSSSDRLTVPHPRAHERAFVLVPWAAADAVAVLPGPFGGCVADLAAGAPDAPGVRARPDVVLTAAS